jgi:hypothetical protein
LLGWGFGLTMTGFGQQFDVKGCNAVGNQRIDQLGELGGMGHFCRIWIGAKLAIKVPKINALGEWFAAFALDVLADLVFGGFDHAVAILALNLELESLFHGVLGLGWLGGQKRLDALCPVGR